MAWNSSFLPSKDDGPFQVSPVTPKQAAQAGFGFVAGMVFARAVERVLSTR